MKREMKERQYPLYDESLEHESCGVGAVVDLTGAETHRTVSDALTMVERLAHRAGCDVSGTTGDGVGILLQIPHRLISEWAQYNGYEIGEKYQYGIGMMFLPPMENKARHARKVFENMCRQEKLQLIAWRDVPCHPGILGKKARETMPRIMQCIIARPDDVQTPEEFDRRLYIVRKVFEKEKTDSYICSLSCRTIVYKGMMLVNELRTFYDDLSSEKCVASIAMVHSRFSTNTNPSWPKAHPHRMLLHNGEINTIRGNADRMLTREETIHFDPQLADMKKAFPVVNVDASDSMQLDNTLEFLTMCGMPMPLAGMILLPEPWQGKKDQTAWRDMYRYYSTMMEPWDGPAAVLASDGRCVCAMLDRNGLRPLRCARTDDDRLILCSETGVLYEEDKHIVRRWRLKAGDILMADIESGKVTEGEELKALYAGEKPYSEWIHAGIKRISDLPASEIEPEVYSEKHRRELLKAFGYSNEDIWDFILPMAAESKNPIASMGADVPIAALSRRHPSLFSFFKQRFAQVTNPPIDALREAIKTDCSVYIGDDGDLLHPTADGCDVLELDTPILTSAELEKIRAMKVPGFETATVPILFERGSTLEEALRRIFEEVDYHYAEGVNVIILSDRGTDADHIAIPSLLAVSAVEMHLIRTQKRTAVSVILESGEPRDIHQMALLISYGARALNPYLAQDCISVMCERGIIKKEADQAIRDYNSTVANGILHIASKMGVSTLQAYQSAQLFEAIGLDDEVVDSYFANTPVRLSGIGLNQLEENVRWHHDHAYYGVDSDADDELDSIGIHRLRAGKLAEEHLYTPEVIHTLQRAVWEKDYSLFEKYTDLIYTKGPRTIRSLLDFRFENCTEIPLSEVEPASSIVHRFKTGAMSYGSLSQEAHECLAEAMNRIGGKSNTGEGGELRERFGTKLNSAVKQVASGRFGVTEEYLLSAKEIQIKMAQGAKPGEGGHLPGKKVSAIVARTRCSTPGLSLISPPPHHDIYSIEDLAQLIYDLKCANEEARIAVKLVSETGVGTVASGVAKAGAQVILISGGEGGTGAAPLTSIHGAGLPWEMGLAETHQILCKNGLREMVVVETDGKLMTGRDVAVAMLLGAEEFAFATAPLITMGCRMMRVCNLDTCPFGVATQNPELRKNFIGKPEYVENFMYFVAEQLRGIMAKLGARTVDELVGRSDLLKVSDQSPLNMEDLIACGENRHFDARYLYDFKLNTRTDAKPVGNKELKLYNTDRSFGTLLGARLIRKYGDNIPDKILEAKGHGGQSFCAFLPKGVTVALEGDTNDYLGKGLSGGKIVIRPPKDTPWSKDDALIGNVALYGATGGSAFIAGTAGERFCVRNSGAIAVAEGVGDHGCEYMTRGRAVILGSVGDNFAAGMSGGIAYVYDPEDKLGAKLNSDMVEMDPLTDSERIDELKAILEEHFESTGSSVAGSILETFDEKIAEFKMIIPTEFKRMLEGAKING